MTASWTNGLLDFIVSPRGDQAVSLAGELDSHRAGDVERLRRLCGIDEARVAFELAELRRRGRSKFSRAEHMVFDRVGYEQSSGEAVSRYKAERLAELAGERPVVDLCCGIGGDAIALSALRYVVAVDRSLVRVRMSDMNLRAYGRGDRCELVCSDVRDLNVGDMAFHLDPDRRGRGGRSVRLEDLQPPVEWIDRLVHQGGVGAIKFSPALDYSSLRWSGELEMISDGGECKQLVLWTGGSVREGLRATVLPARVSVTSDMPARYDVSDIGAYIYDPDGAVVRLRLLAQLAEMLELNFLWPGQVVLTSDRCVVSPLAACYQVEQVMGYRESKLRKYLDDGETGEMTIHPRGVKVNVDRLSRRMSGRAGRRREVFLLRMDKKIIAVVARRMAQM